MGAIAQLPTHTDSALGNDNWGLGPTAVVLRLEKGDPWGPNWQIRAQVQLMFPK